MVSMDPAIERGAARVVGGGSPPRIAPLRVRLPISGIGAVRALIVPLLILAMWQLAVNQEFYSRGQLPAPLDVIAAGRELQDIGLLVPNVLASVERVSIGWGVGAAVAIILGLAVGFSRPVESLLDPTLNALRAVPSLAWVPLFVLWLGIGETPKLTLIALGAFFPVYTNLVSGVRQIDRKLIEVSFGASPMPSQSTNSGTQASDGTARSALSVGPSRLSTGREKPTASPRTMAIAEPTPQPIATRFTLASTFGTRSPMSCSSRPAAMTSSGAGS